MGVLKEFIIPEQRFDEMFKTLPPIIKNDYNYDIFFNFGSEFDLIAYLRNINDTPYPLIWLETPYLEEHKRTNVELNNISLIIAMNSNENTYNKDRLDQNFKPILLKVANDIKRLFNISNTIYTSDEYEISKFYRYGNGTENEFPAVWDAVKLTFSCTINDKCFNLTS